MVQINPAPEYKRLIAERLTTKTSAKLFSFLPLLKQSQAPNPGLMRLLMNSNVGLTFTLFRRLTIHS